MLGCVTCGALSVQGGRQKQRAGTQDERSVPPARTEPTPMRTAALARSAAHAPRRRTPADERRRDSTRPPAAGAVSSRGAPRRRARTSPRPMDGRPSPSPRLIGKSPFAGASLLRRCASELACKSTYSAHLSRCSHRWCSTKVGTGGRTFGAGPLNRAAAPKAPPCGQRLTPKKRALQPKERRTTGRRGEPRSTRRPRGSRLQSGSRTPCRAT